jgi:hypothetical protein
VSVKYLLPCRCGQNVVVEPRQAGQTVVCACGQSLPVPTMLEVTALEPAPVEPETPQAGGSAWGWRQALVLLGGLMLLVAVAGGAWVYKTRPIAAIDRFDPEMVREGIQKLLPTQTWQNWDAAKQQGIGRWTDPRYEDAVIRFRTWTTMVIVVAIGGLALIGIGTAKRRTSASAKRPSDPSLRSG